MAGLSILILFVAGVARGINSPMPALPEKMAGEWLPRPAAYRPAGTKKIIKFFFKKNRKKRYTF